MRGLFAKDLSIIAGRKRAMILYVIIGIILGCSATEDMLPFFISLMFMLLAVGTVSYDEADNGYAFLMTLPITPKSYVKEKYLFSAGLTLAGWTASLIIILAITAVTGKDVGISFEILKAVAAFLSALMIMDLELPFLLKYGMERGRIALICTIGFIVGILVIVNIVLEKVRDESGIMSIDIADIAFMVIFAAAAAVCTLISIKISTKIMENKDF